MRRAREEHHRILNDRAKAELRHEVHIIHCIPRRRARNAATIRARELLALELLAQRIGQLGRAGGNFGIKRRKEFERMRLCCGVCHRIGASFELLHAHL